MKIAICGTPSPLTYWFGHLVRAVVTQALGEPSFIGAGALSEAPAGWADQREAPLLWQTSVPERPLCDLMRETFDRVFIVADRPEDVAGYLRLGHNLSLWESLRFTSQSFSCLANLVGADRAVAVGGALYARTVEDAVESVCHALDVAATPAMAEQLLGPPAAPDDHMTFGSVLSRIAKARAPGAYWDDASDEERALVERTIGLYGETLAGARQIRFTWTIPMFLAVDRKGVALATPIGRMIDLTGPARVLLYGPFLHLPVGRWRLIAYIDIAENVSGNFLQMEVVSGLTDIAKVTAKLPAGGSFKFEMAFSVREPREPLQFRMHILEGAIEGALSLVGVELWNIVDGA